MANLTFSFAKQDTVIDAGMYDGSLGIISAISALKVLKITGKLQRLTRPVEVREFSSISSTVVLLLLYSLHAVLINIFSYDTMTNNTTSVLINLINVTDFFVDPPIF